MEDFASPKHTFRESKSVFNFGQVESYLNNNNLPINI